MHLLEGNNHRSRFYVVTRVSVTFSWDITHLKVTKTMRRAGLIIEILGIVLFILQEVTPKMITYVIMFHLLFYSLILSSCRTDLFHVIYL